MILYDKKEDCCGCSACKSICPKSAIQMFPDDEGFHYPVIEHDKCVDCGLCKEVCAFRNGYNTENNFEEPLVYAVRHKDIKEVETSRSGAVFVALSGYILENNGVVYGVGYADHFRVVHKRAITKQERNEFKGSKYVQSDLNGIFELIRTDLQNEIMVLFSGTPCQTAALYAFLKDTSKERLYSCDIICHGVSSTFIWRDYITYLEKKYKDSILKFDFRDKSMGWKTQFESFVLSKKKRKLLKSTYSQLFTSDATLRPSCGVCKYTNIKRPSDVTIGDYWGWERVSVDINNDDKGVSLLLVNTDNGVYLFEKIKSLVNFLECNVITCLQPNLVRPTGLPPQRDQFWKDYKNYGFAFIVKKYTSSKQVYRALLERSIKKYVKFL